MEDKIISNKNFKSESSLENLVIKSQYFNQGDISLKNSITFNNSIESNKKSNKLESPDESFIKKFPVMIKSPTDNKLTLQTKSSNMSEEEFNINDYMINCFFSQKKAEEARMKLHSFKLQQRKIEFKIIEKISSSIELDNFHEKDIYKTNGSLYCLFKNEYFNMNFIMFYLDKYEENGIIDVLIYLIYERFINASVFYIPQLCTMIIYKKNSGSLVNYILDRCVNQIKFSFQVHWLVSSFCESGDPKLSVIFEKFLQSLEETMVNGRRNNISNYMLHNKNKDTIDTYVIQESIDKELRLKYFEYLIDFYKNLKAMCEKLKEFPREGINGRNAVLKNFIYTFNINLINTRNEHKQNNIDSIANHFFKGIILPFDDSKSASDEENALIVRFIPDQCFCFSTKARVPVKLCVEYIRVKECSKWDDFYLPDEDDITAKAIKIDVPNTGEVLRDKSIPFRSGNKTNMNENDKRESQDQKKISLSINEFYLDQIYQKEKESINGPQEKIDNTHVGNFTVIEEDDSLIINFNPEVINPFGRKFSDITREIREHSPFRKFETYSIKNFIAKANDDLRQELMTMQLIKKFNEIFIQAEIPLKLHPYEILITSSSSGLLEFLTNTNSIDGVKKKLPKNWNLNSFYRNFFKDNFEEAQKNFAESLAAYSLICYYLQIKDRHNGNILLDMKGSIIHIDFGFILGINPGNVNFEKPPFKLTIEYVDILDGLDSAMFQYYKSLMLRGMIEAKKHINTFIKIIEIMSKGSKMPCFEHTDVGLLIKKFDDRFFEKKSDNELSKSLDDMIKNSFDNFWTNKYDSYQKLTNGIFA